jgi:hypothetical protein
MAQDPQLPQRTQRPNRLSRIVVIGVLVGLAAVVEVGAAGVVLRPGWLIDVLGSTSALGLRAVSISSVGGSAYATTAAGAPSPLGIAFLLASAHLRPKGYARFVW